MDKIKEALAKNTGFLDPIGAKLNVSRDLAAHMGVNPGAPLFLVGAFSMLILTYLYGYMIMAINPEMMLPLNDFRRHMSENLARIKATPRLPGVEEIRLPGERSFREREQRLREGIVIDKFIYDALLAVPAGQLPPLL